MGWVVWGKDFSARRIGRGVFCKITSTRGIFFIIKKVKCTGASCVRDVWTGNGYC